MKKRGALLSIMIAIMVIIMIVAIFFRISVFVLPNDELSLDIPYKAVNNCDSKVGLIQYKTESREIDDLRELIEDTLNLSANSFDGMSGRIYGFFAGSGYPQIWVRDSASAIPIARYAYQDEYIRSWIEEAQFSIMYLHWVLIRTQLKLIRKQA